MTTITLRDIVSKTTDLPVMPTAALAVMREAESPEASAQSVGFFVSRDQSLAARVLRLANSAYFGCSKQIMSINEAVMLLGMRTVKNLCLLAGTYPWMSRPIKGYGLPANRLWEHALATAVGTQLLAERTGKFSPELGLMAGLLHDLGKVALGIWIENKLPMMLRIAQTTDTPFDAVERKVLGYDHTDVGGFLGESWNLPNPIVEAMRFHHRPDACPEHPILVDAVHVADHLATSAGIGMGSDGMFYGFSAAAVERLGFTLDDLESMNQEFLERFGKQDMLCQSMGS